MLFAILAIIAYLLSLLSVIPTLKKAEQCDCVKPNTQKVLLLGAAACVLHFVSLSNNLLLQEGQNFTLPNVISAISLMMSISMTFALTKWKTVWHPLSVVYVLGIVSVSLSTFVEGSFIKNLQNNFGLMFHLALAIFSYALFAIALLYALQLKWLDQKLKSKKLMFSPILPPLMTVERHFFTLTLSAQSLLTITLITGMFYLHNFFAPEQVHKAIFSVMAWIVYSIQLLGQWKLHWRGKRVLIYSISGMILLTIGYFGSRI